MNCDILYVITRGDDIGGANIHVRDMSLWMKSRGYNVVVLTGQEGIFNKKLGELGIENFSTKYLKRSINIFSDLYFLFWFYKFCKILKPKLISSHSSKAGILCRISSKLFNICPCIFTAHGWSFTEGINSFQKNIYLFIEKIVGKFTDQIITVCNSDLKLGLKNKIISSNKITCIHNGMKYLPQTKFKDEIKSKFNLISIARFDKQKDHETLIKAMNLIKTYSWKLYLVGSGPSEDKIKEICKRNELESRIVFLGRRHDIVNLLNASDIFVLSSLWEGFPRSILEAMRASLPIIATEVGGVNESVKNDINGFTFQRRDHIGLSNHLIYFFNNPKKIKDYGTKSRTIFEEKFTFKKTALKTLNIYKKFLKS